MSLLDPKSDYEGIIKHLETRLASAQAENERLRGALNYVTMYCNDPMVVERIKSALEGKL